MIDFARLVPVPQELYALGPNVEAALHAFQRNTVIAAVESAARICIDEANKKQMGSSKFYFSAVRCAERIRSEIV